MNLCAFIIPLALFFGLFFGLNYPEIVRHGWPLSQCTVLSSEIVSRYCCDTSCDTNGCSSAPSGSPDCGTLISQLDNNYSPSACAVNLSACPPDIGSVCDGGSYCCGCCGNCNPGGGSGAGDAGAGAGAGGDGGGGPVDRLNKRSIDSTSDLYCTISCPICYDVDLGLRYQTLGGTTEYANYTQDFGQNNSASAFFTQHLVNSTSPCHYNPHDFSQVLFDTSFTIWKWVITAIFGMLPLTIVLGVVVFRQLIAPRMPRVKAGYIYLVASLKDWKFRIKQRMGRKPTNHVLEQTEKTLSNDVSPPPNVTKDT